MEKTFKISEQQLGIKFVNCYPDSTNLFTIPSTIYKYMRLSRVLEMLERKEITFVSPELWNDPFETKYLKTNYSQIGYTRPEQIYCFCVRKDNVNEEASWKIYAHSQDDPLIRLSINTLNLLSHLSSYAQKHNCQIYYSKVDYSLKTKDIVSIYKHENKNYAKYFDDFNEEKYIRVMSLKRQAFKYEHEVRLFLIHKTEKPLTKKLLLGIPIDYDIFRRYTFAPLERNKDDDMASGLKQMFYQAKHKIAKREIKRLDTQTQFHKSSLYDETESVDCIMRKASPKN